MKNLLITVKMYKRNKILFNNTRGLRVIVEKDFIIGVVIILLM